MDDKEVGELWGWYKDLHGPYSGRVHELIRKLVEERARVYRLSVVFPDELPSYIPRALQDFGLNLETWARRSEPVAEET